MQVKVCGVTNVQDALACVDAGADALGINFWTGTPRFCDVATAQEIVRAFSNDVLIIAVFVDETPANIRSILEITGINWVQLHGHETPETLRAFLPNAFKALRVRGESVIEEANRFPGEHLLLDAHVPGMRGGTGSTFDWSLAAKVAVSRKLTLAGGLTPENVAEAIARVKPFRVDVSSGVEKAPGRKDRERVRAFVKAAKQA